jgi:hypothetical protein
MVKVRKAFGSIAKPGAQGLAAVTENRVQSAERDVFCN